MDKQPRNSIPQYLQAKLGEFNICSLEQLSQCDLIKLFKWLQHTYSGLGYQVLADLYCLCHQIPLGSLSDNELNQLKSSYKKYGVVYPPPDPVLVKEFLAAACDQAKQAAMHGEVPVGAVIVKDNQIIAVGYNQTVTRCDILSHAELIAIKLAQQKLGNFRLNDCDLYVTIEPCLMCAGAIMQTRIRRLVFGALEPKTGAVVSQYQTFKNTTTNHHTEVIGPIDNKFYSRDLKEFFLSKRS